MKIYEGRDEIRASPKKACVGGYAAHRFRVSFSHYPSIYKILVPRNDVLTTYKVVTLRGGQRITAVFFLQ